MGSSEDGDSSGSLIEGAACRLLPPDDRFVMGDWWGSTWQKRAKFYNSLQ